MNKVGFLSTTHGRCFISISLLFSAFSDHLTSFYQPLIANMFIFSPKSLFSPHSVTIYCGWLGPLGADTHIILDLIFSNRYLQTICTEYAKYSVLLIKDSTQIRVFLIADQGMKINFLQLQYKLLCYVTASIIERFERNG